MVNDILRAQRLANLRNALNAELARRGLSQKTFTNIAINSSIIKAADVNDIRNSINKIKSGSYTDKITANETVVKDIHFSELEKTISMLASHPKQGGTTDCAGGCTGMCVSCSGSCKGMCVSCSGSCKGICASCDSCNSECGWSCSYVCDTSSRD